MKNTENGYFSKNEKPDTGFSLKRIKRKNKTGPPTLKPKRKKNKTKKQKSFKI